MIAKNLNSVIAVAATPACGDLLSSCSSSRPVARSFESVRVPPGVTPLTAAHADSLALQLFVSLEEERQAHTLIAQAEQKRAYADSLLSVLDRAAAKQIQVSPADSAAAAEATREGYQKVQQGTPFVQKYVTTQDEQARQKAIAALQEAEAALTNALQLNPYSVQTRALLAAVYRVLGERLTDKTNHDRAIAIWETLVRLEPGEYNHYFRLGENYFAGQAWQPALDNFEKCEQRLLASAEVKDSRIQNPAQPVAAAVDSSVLFLSVYYQGLSAIKLLNEEKAYTGFRRALTLTSAPENREAVQNNLKWLDWDDGHIMGAVLRDTAAARASRGQFVAASNVYKELLPNLRSASARFEVGRNIAILDFSQLNHKEEACERMLKIVESIPHDASGAPIDKANQVYLDTYGTMCLNLGNEKIEVDRKLAYTYFMQSAAIPWSGRGKSYFAMATLAESDPRQTVQDAAQAYQLVHQLAADEVVNLHKLLIRNYRRLGEFAKAKMHFDELLRLQGATAQTSPGLD
jgi:tetratricopeptide (TPR) repeat protein